MNGVAFVGYIKEHTDSILWSQSKPYLLVSKSTISYNHINCFGTVWDCFGTTSCSKSDLEAFIFNVNSFHPSVHFTRKISEIPVTFLPFLLLSLSTVSILPFIINPLIPILTYCIHHHTPSTLSIY